MKLMDLFEFMPKSKFSASYGSDKGNYPFFTSSNTIDKYCDDFIYDGEFLIIGDGGTGNCKHYNGKFSVSDHNYVLKPKSQTNALAVKYFLEKDNYQILNDGFKGIGIKNVSKSYIQNIDYKYNQHFSQNEIVKNLVLIEKNIEREKQSINSLDCLIKSRFIELFKNIDLNDKQADWKSLKDVATIVGGSTPKTENKEYWNGNNKWITPAEIDKDTFYVFDSERHITEAGVKSCTLQLLPINTVLLTSRAPIGKVAITGAEMYCNQGFKNIICSKHLHHYYVYYLLEFNVKYLNAIGSGTTFKEISKTVVENIRIPVPDYRNQELFASFTEQINKLKFNCQQRIKLYQELLDKKMDEYFG